MLQSFSDVLASTSAMPQQAQDQIDWHDLIERIGASKQLPAEEIALADDVLRYVVPVSALDPDELQFEKAYHTLADRRGANATPAGRTASRKVWLDAGANAARWLIERLRTEQHPEMIIGIAETITELGDVALPIALAELEHNEVKPKYAALIEALAWMRPPPQFLFRSRIARIIDRYLASPHLDCGVAGVQLTRLLDDDAARIRLGVAKENAGQRLREEIEDVLSERFGE